MKTLKDRIDELTRLPGFDLEEFLGFTKVPTLTPHEEKPQLFLKMAIDHQLAAEGLAQEAGRRLEDVEADDDALLIESLLAGARIRLAASEYCRGMARMHQQLLRTHRPTSCR